jgi:Skp family chaperone for outer membrane proteins
MKKLLNWLFPPVKEESEEEKQKRVAEISATIDELKNINAELEKTKRELAALNKSLNQPHAG